MNDEASLTTLSAKDRSWARPFEHETQKSAYQIFTENLKQPTNSESINRIRTSMEKLPEDPDFTYSQASQTAYQYGEYLRNVMASGGTVSFSDDKSRQRFIEAYRKIHSMSRVQKVLTQMQRIAENKPGDFFNDGTSIEGYFDVQGGQAKQPIIKNNPLKRACYNFLIGAYPARHMPDNPSSQRAIDVFKDRRRQEVLKEELNKLANLRRNWIAGEKQPYVGDGNFFWTGSALGEPRSPGSGKLFLNPLPQHAHRIFLETVKAFSANPQLAWTMKMTDPEGNIDALKIDRADKIVLYFSPSQETAVLNILRKLYTQLGPKVFENVTPALAARIRNTDGSQMSGISFGQEPDPKNSGQRSSFNNKRESVFLDLQRKGYLITSPGYQKKLKLAFKEFSIDPVNPIFNDPPAEGENLFPSFKAACT